MILLTKEIEKLLPPLYSTNGQGFNAIAYLKLFHPLSQWTWFATEYDPIEKLFYGYVIGHEKEWGNFSLIELESIQHPLPIERDLYFTPQPLQEVLK